MVRLLLRKVDTEKHPTDEKINAGQFRLGDVVTMIEDGQEWRPGDLGPWHEPVDIEGYTVLELQHLLSSEVKTKMRTDPITQEMISEDEVIQLRQWKVKNLAALKLVSGVAQGQKGQEMTFTNNFFKLEKKADDKIKGG